MRSSLEFMKRTFFGNCLVNVIAKNAKALTSVSTVRLLRISNHVYGNNCSQPTTTTAAKKNRHTLELLLNFIIHPNWPHLFSKGKHNNNTHFRVHSIKYIQQIALVQFWRRFWYYVFHFHKHEISITIHYICKTHCQKLSLAHIHIHQHSSCSLTWLSF